MHEQIENLRARIDGVDRGTGGRRVFTAAIRKDATALAKQWLAKGRTVKSLADALSLHKTTLRAWLEEPKSTKRSVRPVRVANEPTPPPAPTAKERDIVATMPSGMRIEGLDLDDVLRLESALR